MGIVQRPALTSPRDGMSVNAYDYGVKPTATLAQNAGAITRAMAAAAAAGLPYVDVPAGVYQVGADTLQFVQGVYLRGAVPRQAFTTNQPDLVWSMTGGTIFEGPGSGTLIQFQGSGGAAVDWSARSLANAGMLGIGIRGYAKGLSAGGTTQQGLHFSTFQDLYFTDITDTAIEYINGQHLTANRIYGYIAGNGFRFVDDIDLATYGSTTGSRLDDITWTLTGYNAFGFSFEAKSAGTSANLNEIKGDRLMTMAFSNRTPVSQVATITSGSSAIAVTDTSKFPVGIPVVFSATVGSTAGQQFLINKVYFVLSRTTSSGAGNLTLSERFNGTAITPNASGTPNIKCNGQALARFVGWNSSGNDALSNIHINNLDTEGTTTCAVVMQDCSRVNLAITETGTGSNVLVGGCVRNSQFSTVWSGTDKYWDFDAVSSDSNGVMLNGRKATPLVSSIYTEPDRNVPGWWYDHSMAIANLNLNRSCGIRSAVNNFLRPTVGMGQYVFARSNSITLAAAQSGIVCFTGSSGQTLTLPTIDGSAHVSHLVGIPFWIINVTANSVAIATSSSQLFNGIAAKTSLTLLANSSIMLQAVSTQSSTSIAAATYHWGVLSYIAAATISAL